MSPPLATRGRSLFITISTRKEVWNIQYAVCTLYKFSYIFRRFVSLSCLCFWWLLLQITLEERLSPSMNCQVPKFRQHGCTSGFPFLSFCKKAHARNPVSAGDGREKLICMLLDKVLWGLGFHTNLLGNGEPSHTLLKVCLNLACWRADFSETFINLRVAWNLIQLQFSVIQGSLINVSQSSLLQISKKRHCIVYGMLCSISNPCEKAL